MYYCDVDATVESVQNCPTTHAFSLFVEIGAASEVVQTLKTWHDGNGYKTTVYVRSKYPEWGAGWQKLATATPPQEFDLPLYDGFTVNVRCFYYKTQEDVVHVIGGVNGSFPYKLSTTIGQLPAGFRPSAATRGIAVTNNAPAYIQINTNGAVVLYEMGLDGTPAGTSAFFVLSFVAAD